MKKIILGVFVLTILLTNTNQAHASIVDDLLSQIKSLRTELSLLKSNQSASVLGVTADTTPRIMYWSGKINQHVDSNGVWQTDPDGRSGAGIDKLTYCKKWYPNTVSVQDYMYETISTWRAGGNTGAYTSTKMSTKCVQKTVSIPNRIATVTSSAPTNITYNGAIITGNVTDLGIPASVSARGVCFKGYGQASRTDSSSTCVPATGISQTVGGSFTVNLTGKLSPSTSYSFITYADHQQGPAQSSQRTFSTPAKLVPINGGWTNWSNSGSCINGLQSQTRTCTNPAPANGGAQCVGSANQSVGCTNPVVSGIITASNCQIPLGKNYCVSNIKWSVVNPKVGSNYEVRTLDSNYNYLPTLQTVTSGNSGSVNYAIGMKEQIFWIVDISDMNKIIATTQPIAADCIFGAVWNGLSACVSDLDGGWSPWVNSGSCVNGIQSQTRTCTNPTPVNNGVPCVGSSTQQIRCGNANMSCSEQGGSVCASYEVCQGDVLGSRDSNRCCFGKCDLPSSFDWRNRHGDDWNSPVKNQGDMGYCTVFSGVAPIESAINLYYNQHLDIDLSEQSFMCNSGLYPFASKSCSQIQTPAKTICNTKFFGILEEACYPYKNTADQNIACVDLCPNKLSYTWKVTDFIQLVNQDHRRTFTLDENNNVFYSGPLMDALKQEELNELNLKIKLITHGPVGADNVVPGHAASIVGWKDLLDGKTSWIIKNSYGPYANQRGYFDVIKEAADFWVVGVVQTPVIPPSGKNYSILCVDKDKDNFCNWGISKEKPSSCPSTCKLEKDWDDSNPNIGALGIQ